MEWAQHLRSLPKEIRWWGWSYEPPEYLIRKGVTCLREGVLLAEARAGQKIPLTSSMQRALEEELQGISRRERDGPMKTAACIRHIQPPQMRLVSCTYAPDTVRAARAHGAILVRKLRATVKAATGKAPTYAYLYYDTPMPGACPVNAQAKGVTVYP